MFTEKYSNKKQTYIFLCVFVLCAGFLLWKMYYGYIFNDEPFMITLGHRLLKGDRLLVHEWQKCQTTGLFFAPFIWLYTNITDTTEGLILFCRFIYVIWWLFTSVVLYRRLKQFGWISIVAVVSFLMFTPLDQMNMTYNAVSVSCMLLFVSYFLVEGNVFFDFVDGVVLAAAVLAYPYLIIFYIIYAISVIAVNVTKIKNNAVFKIRLFDAKLFFRVTFSAVVLAIIVLLFVFSAGIKDVMVGLRDVFTTNAGAQRNVVLLAKNIIASFPLQMSVGLLILSISIFDKNRYKRRLLYMVFQTVIWIVTMIIVLLKIYYFNIIMFPIIIVALQAFILTRQKNYLLMFSFWITGIIYGLICYISSDTGVMAIATGATVASIASFIIIFDFYKELSITLNSKKIKMVASLMMVILITIQLGGQIYLRVLRQYHDELILSLDSTISVGAAKGIVTTKGNADQYTKVYNDVNIIKSKYSNNLNFLSIGMFPSVYIDMDCEYATYSSWVFTNNKANYEVENEKLKKYYQLNPDKVADIIFSQVGYVEGYMDFVDFTEYDNIKLEAGVWYIRK